jgi:hypothetical protein
MGCCLLALIALFIPRIVMVFILLLTDWFSRAYDTFWWPFLGFIFMPLTTLAYMAAMINNDHSVSGGWIVLLIIAVLCDLGCVSGGSASKKK